MTDAGWNRSERTARIARRPSHRGSGASDWPSDARAAARRGLDEQAANRTVTLYVIVGDEVDIGTGVCLEYMGHHYIATAAHVIERWGPDASIGIIPKAAGNLETNPARTVNRLGFTPRIGRVVISPHPLDDLAVLELKERPVGTRDENFYRVDFVEPRPLRANRQVLVYGYPEALLKTWRRGHTLLRFNTSPLSDAPRIARVARTNPIFKSRKFNPALHFLMDFPRIRGAVENPKGMSGAGVWHPVLSGQGIWRPTLQLIGIQIRWHESERLLVATRVKRLWWILRALADNGEYTHR